LTTNERDRVRGNIFIVKDKSKSNVRRIFATDKKTNLPLKVELQEKFGEKWRAVLKTKFDYTKSAPKEVLKSAG
jgi:hypothetical protein